MDHIEFVICEVDEVIEVAIDFVEKHFCPGTSVVETYPEIETELASFMSEIQDTSWCLIEFPYVDRVFRDSFYNYYSSKNHLYSRDCIRISFFSNQVHFKQFVTKKDHSILQNSFRGYVVLRPTLSAIIGRSLIDPRIKISNSFVICMCSQTVSVFGLKLQVHGFPHSSQDRETITCAETTIWTIMEYFGSKYPDYKPTLPNQIMRSLEKVSTQRQLPSKGLTMDQVSFALKDFGFGTRIYSKASYQALLPGIIDNYIESGIPVVAGLESEKHEGHAIVIIGKKRSSPIDWSLVATASLKYGGKQNVEYIDSTSIPARYIVQDDNVNPYVDIDLNDPGEHYEYEDDYFQIDSVVVPLYPKIYLESVVARSLMLEILTDRIFGYKFKRGFIFRLFLTSGRSFKHHICLMERMSEELKYRLLNIKMSKFIWCAELYSQKGFDNSNAEGLIILDATEANGQSVDALIFAGYPDRCVSKFENKFASLQSKFEGYSYFSNLS